MLPEAVFRRALSIAEDDENEHLSDHAMKIFILAGILLVLGIGVRLVSTPYWLRKFVFVTPTFEVYYAPNFRTAATSLGLLPALNLLFLGGAMLDYDNTANVGMVLAALFLAVSVVSVLFRANYFASQPPKSAAPAKFLTASNVYEDFSKETAQALLMGISQVLLLGAYMWGIWESGLPNFGNGNGREYLYYGMGILVQIGYIYGKGWTLDVTASDDFWVKALAVSRLKENLSHYYLLSFTNLRKPGDSHIDIDGRGVTFSKSWIQLWIRFLLSKSINTSGLFILFGLLPFQLASSGDPVEFILTAVAAFFIVEIDDQDEAHFGNHETMYPVQKKRPVKPRIFLPLSNAGATSTDFVLQLGGSASIGTRGNDAHFLLIELDPNDVKNSEFQLVQSQDLAPPLRSGELTDSWDSADTVELSPRQGSMKRMSGSPAVGTDALISPEDPYNLYERFVLNHHRHFSSALDEVRKGCKRGHWMWFIIPCAPYIVDGVERGSPTNRRFALRGGNDCVKAYLSFESPEGTNLRTNYLAILRAIEMQLQEKNTLAGIFGPWDEPKVISSVRLFQSVAMETNDDELAAVCGSVLAMSDTGNCIESVNS